MKKSRKIQFITMIVLVVAVVGMSIGFAVFSNILTISSSATVTPNEDDFNVTIYGVVDYDELVKVAGSTFTTPDLTKWSTTTAYHLNTATPLVFESNQYDATINNSGDELMIQNITGNFTAPGARVTYAFAIKNEGAYDVYFNMSDEMYSLSSLIKSCVPGEGATPALVENACNKIVPALMFSDSSGEDVDWNNYKINVGDYIIVLCSIIYDNDGDARADGPFTMEFVDLKFEFSSAPKS